MKNDPRTIYPGTSYYAGLTAPMGGNAGMGFNTLPDLTVPRFTARGLSPASVHGPSQLPPLSSVFSPSAYGTTMR